MPVVVSDTSPLRALQYLAHLDWLHELFGHVFLPPAVAAELRRPPATYTSVDVSEWPYLEVRAPQNAARVTELQVEVDPGEAEAIALAEELQADVVLIDELAGRDVAIRSGLTVVGTLGVLLEAKRFGLCTAVKPLLDRLQTELNFFVSPGLRSAMLQQAGEHL
jgi:uncharacterized protein